MTWPSNGYFVNQRMDTYFQHRNVEQTFKDDRDRLERRRGDYGSTSDISAPSTEAGITLEKELHKKRQEFNRELMGLSNANNKSCLAKIFLACCGKK